MSGEPSQPRVIDISQEQKLYLKVSEGGSLLVLEWRSSRPRKKSKEVRQHFDSALDTQKEFIQFLEMSPGELRKWFQKKFDINELRELCQDLQDQFLYPKVEFDSLPLEGMCKAESLAARLARHGKISVLIDCLISKDPNLLQDLEVTIKSLPQYAKHTKRRDEY